MSIRTIIEINHDHLSTLQVAPEFLFDLLRDLGGSRHSGELNRANEEGKPLNLGCGIHIVLQRHHSEDVTVKTKYVKVRL